MNWLYIELIPLQGVWERLLFLILAVMVVFVLVALGFKWMERLFGTKSLGAQVEQLSEMLREYKEDYGKMIEEKKKETIKSEEIKNKLNQERKKWATMQSKQPSIYKKQNWM